MVTHETQDKNINKLNLFRINFSCCGAVAATQQHREIDSEQLKIRAKENQTGATTATATTIGGSSRCGRLLRAHVSGGSTAYCRARWWPHLSRSLFLFCVRAGYQNTSRSKNINFIHNKLTSNIQRDTENQKKFITIFLIGNIN